jgi:hypothetical protein
MKSDTISKVDIPTESFGCNSLEYCKQCLRKTFKMSSRKIMKGDILTINKKEKELLTTIKQPNFICQSMSKDLQTSP